MPHGNFGIADCGDLAAATVETECGVNAFTFVERDIDFYAASILGGWKKKMRLVRGGDVVGRRVLLGGMICVA